MNRLAAALGALLCFAAPGAQALLSNDYEKLSYAEALRRVKADPTRHVMIYFGLETYCPPCIYTRGLLSGSALVARYRPHYLVVEIDLRDPGAEGRAVIQKYGARWAPTLVFLNAQGKRVARLAKGFKNEKEAILVDEFISGKLYARSDLEQYVKANFNASGAERVIPETKVAKAAAPADDRPRLRDVLAQKHERVLGDALKTLLPGKRMEKENQDWFLTMHLAPGGEVAASGKRKDGKGEMRGPGKWYVTKKGKMCIELKADGLDETWCRHVFRVGENYYYATKDLREKSLAYRFTLEKT
jgi:thiol-disulfide isomerase/thioredoxin